MPDEDKNLLKQEQSKFLRKSKLRKALISGIHGPPRLKREEKRHFLGEFRERVIKALTLSQIHEEGTYDEILEAIRHPRAKKLKVIRDADLEYAGEYIQLAREEGLSFSTVDSPEHKGSIGLVVVSDSAVNVEDIMVESRKDKLKEKGVPVEIIDAIGEKLCGSCFKILSEKAPEETGDYEKLNLIDRFLGKRCEACGK